MSCPDIYIAPSYWTTPHAPEYGNTAIDVGAAGTVFVAGDNRTIQVTVRNHGTDDSPSSRLELYWADPGTSFALLGQIDVSKFGVVPGGDGISTDGPWTENFSWTPSTSVVWPNGGHVCLLAQVGNESSPTGAGCMAQGHTASAAAATDARSAIRNIHVSSAMGMKMSRIPGGSERGLNFAFVATDAGAHRGETRIHVRPLDPGKDREKLEGLVADPAVRRALACARGKFALPEDVLVAEGTERVVLPRPTVVVRKGSSELRRMPRIGSLGTLDNAVAARLLPHGGRLMAAKSPLSLNLVPGEMRQTIVHVVPRESEALYAVAVDHVGPGDQPIGGLVIIFVPPPDRF
jgi:hypothetical protein